MHWTSTVWRLADGSGRPARCLVSEREGRWQVIVWNHRSLVFWERRASSRDAWARADELRGALLAQGWRAADAVPPLRPGPEWRTCPQCRQRPALVQRCGDQELGFLCAACGHRWCAVERLAPRDRRARLRGPADRRHAFPS